MNLIEEILKDLPEAEMPVDEIRMGPFLTTVRLAEGPGKSRCGLSSTVARHDPAEPHGFGDAGTLEGRSARELAGYLLGAVLPRSSIGMASLNAMLDIPVRCFEGIPFLETVLKQSQGKAVGVIGHFPFIDRLRPVSAKLNVLELRSIPGDLPASKAEEVLPSCDVIVLTATVLINGTYEQVLPLCKGAFTVMVGPSTPASPLLFAQGVDMLAGSMVVDPDRTLREVSQGATYRDLSSVKKWVWRKGSVQ